MKFTDVIKRSSRNLGHAKARTLLTASAIAVGGFTLTLTLAASAGARHFTNSLVQANFDPKAVFVAKDKALFGGSDSSGPREYSTDLSGSLGGRLLKQFTPADLAKIKDLPHVTQVLPNYSLAAQFVTRPDPGARKYTGAINSMTLPKDRRSRRAHYPGSYSITKHFCRTITCRCLSSVPHRKPLANKLSFR